MRLIMRLIHAFVIFVSVNTSSIKKNCDLNIRLIIRKQKEIVSAV